METNRKERRGLNKAMLIVTGAIALLVVIGIVWWSVGGRDVAGPVEAPATSAPGF